MLENKPEAFGLFFCFETFQKANESAVDQGFECKE